MKDKEIYLSLDRKEWENYTFQYPPIGWWHWLWRLVRYGGSQRRELNHKWKKAIRNTTVIQPLEIPSILENDHAPSP